MRSNNINMGEIIPADKKENMLPFIKDNFNKLSEREMARRLNIGKTSVNRWCKELGLFHKRYTANENFFSKWNSVMAYVLGYIFADGNINWNPEKCYRSLTITAAEKDRCHLEKIRLITKNTKPLLYSISTKSYRFIINNKTICKDLMKLGITPRKSLTVKFPFVPEKFLRHFIRGVIDGDGSVRYNKRERSPYFEITICSGSESFLKVMADKISKQGINATVRVNKNGVYILQYSCKRGMKLAKWIYSNGPICLERKREQYKTALNAGGGHAP